MSTDKVSERMKPSKVKLKIKNEKFCSDSYALAKQKLLGSTKWYLCKCNNLVYAVVASHGQMGRERKKKKRKKKEESFSTLVKTKNHPLKKRFENTSPTSKHKVKDIGSMNYFRKTERKEDLNLPKSCLKQADTEKLRTVIKREMIDQLGRHQVGKT
ncbi:hypothetical protein WISP_31888 [Willisornis vidua]|uniref:Uncharacterized protein n=1 Tax=Willisornis vidua TaxID=1566151 RepID=A0ABQ9DQT7_9PASS|nr:hypothetical protein WISP_31888 [Willisornis vidua]